jgi:NTE family protein
MDDNQHTIVKPISPDIRLGLALSGGGFRASLFHIGVMARLADLGILPYVQVVSAVSGGSIIAALYYLYLKNLIETKPDEEICYQDYITLLKKMEIHFLTEVQKNIRLRVLANPFRTAQMMLTNYSRTDRIGELLNECLYRPAYLNDTDYLRGQNPRKLELGEKNRVELRKIKICPRVKNSDEKMDKNVNFHPGKDGGNRERNAKVPVLIINCSSLNTGRNWRFNASRMGEEPPKINTLEEDLDRNMRLERPASYDDTKFRKDFPLGKAVAASAAVPGLFQPLSVSQLYYDEGSGENIMVQLVDGGVFDNLGVEALMDAQPALSNKNCSHLIISDASGQLKNENNPATFFLSVLGRTTNMLMKRVREEELLRLIHDQQPILAVRERADKLSMEPDSKEVILTELDQILKPVVFMHLLRGVPVAEHSYAGNSTSVKKPDAAEANNYGINPQVQRLLADIRTDLDTFTDVEAYSLMADGYLMVNEEFPDGSEWEKIRLTVQTENSWRFLEIKDRLEKQPQGRYLKQLEAASQTAFKIFKLNPWKAGPIAVLLFALIISPISLLLWSATIPMGGVKALLSWIESTGLGQLIASAAFFIILLVFLVIALKKIMPYLKRFWEWARYLRTPLTQVWLKVLGPIILATLVSGSVWLYLLTLDRIFRNQGKINKVSE